MANEYSLNQTTQAEVGGFFNLYAYSLEVSDQAAFTSSVNIEGYLDVDSTALVSRLFVENNALVSGRIKTQEVELGTFVAASNPQPGDDPEDFVPFSPAKLLSELFDAVQDLETAVATNTANIATNTANIATNTANIASHSH